MKISLEIEFDAEYHEHTSGRVSITSLKFPGCNQNLLQFLSTSEGDAAQQAVEDAVEGELQAKYDAIRERKELRGDRMADIAREEQQEELASREAQRGIR